MLVFGATGGLGRALSARLDADGWPLFLSARTESALAEMAAAHGAEHAAGDVLDSKAIAAVVERASSSGGLAGLAYCVGSIVLKPLRAASEDEFVAAYRLNVLGAALAIRAAQDALVAGGGSVVLFSSVAVSQGFANHAVISAAKGGVEGLTRALAAEMAPAVRVNAIAPSLTRTAMAAPLVANGAMADAIAKLHAIPRLGEPDDLAAAAAFLLGPDSGWVTGQVLPVDGGRARVRTRG